MYGESFDIRNMNALNNIFSYTCYWRGTNNISTQGGKY